MRSLRRWVLGLFLLGLAFSITLSESALALLALLWLWSLRDPGARAAQRFPLGWPVLAFGAATLLSALFSADPRSSLVDSKGLLLLLILYVLLGLLRDVEAAETFLTALFLLLAIHAGLAVVQVLVCPSDRWGLPVVGRYFKRCDRAHGFFSIYMTLAGILSLSLLATLPRLTLRGAARRWWLAAVWAVSGLGLILTFTRGAWLGFLVGAASLSLLLKRVLALVVMGGVLVILALVLLQSEGLLGVRLHRLEDPGTLRERVQMWEAGWAIFRDHPLTGVGPGQIKVAYTRYVPAGAIKKTSSHVHNTPLQILAERGLLGLAAWLWLWIAFLARGIRLLGRLGAGQARERGLAAGSLAAIVGFLTGGLFEFNFGDSEVVMVAYALMALLFVVERESAPSPFLGRVNELA